MGRRRPAVSLTFLDSSVLFSAVNSPAGGSAKLFTLKNLKLITSTLVLTEVERNIRRKLLSYHLERFFLLVENLEIIDRLPTKQQIRAAQRVIVEKDAIILASGIISKADFIVSLDRKHFLKESVIEYIKPQKVVIPKMLIKG